MNAHMYAKFKLTDSPHCSCGMEHQTTEHILQKCPQLEQLRKDVWPLETELKRKLYGTMEELKKTAYFIDVAGLRL